VENFQSFGSLLDKNKRSKTAFFSDQALFTVRMRTDWMRSYENPHTIHVSLT
jgi:hypothetical protein